MRYIAADFGAGSGRVMVGSILDGQIRLEELHRFYNRQITLNGRIYWDFLFLFEELKTGLRKAFSKYGDDIKSIGIDTWGVDYGLIDKDGFLLSNPVCYRDNRTKGVIEHAFTRLCRQDFYEIAGNQFLEINTVFQLLSAKEAGEQSLQSADKLLFMPDLFNYFLTGKCFNEYTIASTSQLLNSTTRQWDHTIFAKLGLNRHLMQEIVYPKTVIGELTDEIRNEVGGNAQVVAVGSHDTAGALASLGRQSDTDAFISSGTWSLMGIQTDQPIQTDQALRAGFTNEGTAFGKICFLKNLTGLWLIQALVKVWENNGTKIDYNQLVNEARFSTCRSVVDVEDDRFTNPQNMQQTIVDYCSETGQAAPESNGDFMRCVCLSLATKYAEVKLLLEQCSDRKIDTIHIVGGGSQNRLLTKLTAEKTGCRIVIGTVEATAYGNIMVQAMASGEISSVEDFHTLTQTY